KDSCFDLTAYSDADHAGCHLDRKTESKNVAVSSCCAQVLWMRTQLTNYGFFYDKVSIYCDSKSAIAISCNPDEEEEEPSEDEDEEDEEHLALVDSALYVPDYVPLAEETEPFETDEPVATPPPHTSPHIVIPLSQTRLRRARISVRPHTPPSPSTEAHIAEVRFTAPSHRYKIRKSSTAVTTRQTGLALTRGVDYGFIDTLDASIRATNERVMTALEGRIDDGDRLTRHIQHEHERFTKLERIRDVEHQDGPADVGSSSNRGSGNESHSLGSGNGRMPNTTRVCTYKDFLNYQPFSYKGTEGVVGSVMASKPKTMQEAIEIAIDLMGQKVRSFSKIQSENKRKLDDNIRNNKTQQQPFKRKILARAYTVRLGEKKEYGRSLPLCTKVQGHYKKDCLKLKNKNRGNQARNVEAHGKACVFGGGETNTDSNVVMGTFLLNNRYDSILFDTGADRSFVSVAFSSLINIIPSTLDNSYDVELANGKITGVNTIIWGHTLNLLNHPFNINLMLVEVGIMP
nr:hypothetical protein [Tanacetum cinerariifolium]